LFDNISTTKTEITLIPCWYFEKRSRSREICKHSSRVGHKTSAWTLLFCADALCNNGNPNAAVFPVPVMRQGHQVVFIA
jgi:hypothetical protein